MENREPVELDPLCIDMLKEVGHICSGNAAVALSQVLNKKVELTIPDFKLIDANKVLVELNGTQEVLVGVNLQLLGNHFQQNNLLLAEYLLGNPLNYIIDTTNYLSPIFHTLKVNR